jgi:hypothetical protein
MWRLWWSCLLSLGLLVGEGGWAAAQEAAPSPAAAPPLEEAPSPESNTLANGLLAGGGAVGLVSGPMVLLSLHPELGVGGAAQVGFSSFGGALFLTLGGLGVAGGVGMMTIGLLLSLIAPQEGGELMLAGAIAGGVGVGLVLLAPLVFGWGTSGVEGPLGERPENPFLIGGLCMLSAGAAGGLLTWGLEDVDADWWAKALLVLGVGTLASNLTYGLLRLPAGDEAPPVMVASPLLFF